MLYNEQLRRIKILGVIIAAVILALILRMAWMQLFQGAQYKKVAEENRIRKIYSQAPRGTFYDRNGAVLVGNRPSFALSIVPAEFTSREAIACLAQITDMAESEIASMLVQGKAFPYTPVRIKRDIDPTIIAKVEERKNYLPGVIIEAIPVRHYVYKQLAAHVFGYVGKLNEEEYKVRQKQGYKPDDFIGKDGLEHIWEEMLHGVDGGREVEVTARGEEVGIIGDKPAKPGNSLVLTLDANLQKAAEQALEAQIARSRAIGEPAKGGAVVALDVRTGAVRVMASYPAFDPNAFAAGITAKDWKELIKNPDNPLINRAIQNSYPPGSVFKIVTAAAALDRQVTTGEEIFNDKGVYVLDGWQFYGWNPKGLGRLTVADALAWSSDPVFYELGRRIGSDKLASYAYTFGYGKLTGIKLPGEHPGIVPTENWKQENFGEMWYPGETLIAAIGQGYYLATPLQQAMLLMAVANKGTAYRPALVDKVISPDGAVISQTEPEVIYQVNLQPEHWKIIQDGLVAVTTRGTAAVPFQGFVRTVAGKTGSSETGRKTTHSWFACYAPAEAPEVAVAVFVEDGGDGSVAAAPVARKVLEAYFDVQSRQEPPVLPKGKTD